MNNTRARPEQMGQLANNALEVQCQNCGAKSLFMPPEVAGRCEFCGVQIVAQPKSADPIMAPEGVLPFRVSHKDAGDNLRQWLSSLWFAPSGLKQFAQPEKIHGIYIPFWVYYTNTSTEYVGQRGDYYWETETYTKPMRRDGGCSARGRSGTLAGPTRQERFPVGLAILSARDNFAAIRTRRGARAGISKECARTILRFSPVQSAALSDQSRAGI